MSLRSVVADLRRPHRPGCTAETGECEFQRWGVDHVRPECCTEHLTELLFFVEDLLADRGITHWLDWGVLLGAVRDGELIPWDPDGDFGVLDEEFGAVAALEREVNAAGYFFEPLDGGCRVCYSRVNKLHVDILRWRRRDDGLLETTISFAVWPGMAESLAFPPSYVDPPGTVTLYGKEFAAPAPVDGFLADHRYGPGWRTPKRPTNEDFVGRLGSLGDVTPVVDELLGRVGEAERRLEELSRSRLSRFRPWRVWVKSGLPVAPESVRVERLRGSIPPGELTPAAETLVASLAMLEQAIDECERLRPGTLARRSYRRGVRLREAASARAAGRPHRAGFPFGV